MTPLTTQDAKRASVVVSGEILSFTPIQVTSILAIGGAITGSVACVSIVGLEIFFQGDNPLTDLTILGFPALLGGLGRRGDRDSLGFHSRRQLDAEIGWAESGLRSGELAPPWL